MGFLDSIKDSVSSMMGGKKNEPDNALKHAEPPSSNNTNQKQSGGFLSSLLAPLKGKPSGGGRTTVSKPVAHDDSDDDDNRIALFDGDDDYDYDSTAVDAEIQGHRSDVLDLLHIPDNYEVPDSVLLVGDLDRVRFDVTQPQGYDMSMVEEFFDTVQDSIRWYCEKLQQRNNDIRKMEDMLNKQNTELHNAKVAESMSDPDFAVMTGSESTAEQELQEAQVRIMNLEDENRKLKARMKGDTGDVIDAETQSRYDALQNQLGIVQRENQKLKSQLKRQALAEAVSLDRQEGEYTIPDDDDDGMPMPGMPVPSVNPPTADEQSSDMPMPASSQQPDDDGMSMPMSSHGDMPSPGDDDMMPMPNATNHTGANGKKDDTSDSMPLPAPGTMPGAPRHNVTSQSYHADRASENSVGAMTMADALKADNAYDLDEASMSPFNRRNDDDDDDFDYDGFSNPFSLDYDDDHDSGDNAKGGKGKKPSSLNIPVPESMDNGDFDEVDLFDDDDDDSSNGVINMDDYLN